MAQPVLCPAEDFHFCLARSRRQHICQRSGCDLNDFSTLNATGINQFFIVVHKRQVSPLSLGFVYFCFWHFCLWSSLHFWDVLGIPDEIRSVEVSKYKMLMKSFSLPSIEHIPKVRGRLDVGKMVSQAWGKESNLLEDIHQPKRPDAELTL